MALSSVDDFPDFLWEGDERAQVVPVSEPLPTGRGILLDSALRKAFQRGRNLVDAISLVDCPEVLRLLLAILPIDLGYLVAVLT